MSHEFDNVVDSAGLALASQGTAVDDFKREYEAALRKRLQESIPVGAAAYCTIEPIMTHGKPWREILRVAAERQNDLIVMGVEGRGATDLFVFGSTTEHVVRGATCPVLTLGHR
jgi:nucleotide-binding universal stress UspA family protein